MAKVVNIRKEKCDVYIGRGSIWGNPYVIGIDGNRDEVIEKYEFYARRNKKIMESLLKLDNKKLGCYCKPLNCHGDILVKLIEELKNKNKNKFKNFIDK